MSSPRFGLRSGQRLRGARAFAELRASGKRRVCGCLILNWRVLAPGAVSQLGVVTSRRLGNAVVRSRARRLMREVFRLSQHQFREPLAMILVARSSMVGRPLRMVRRDFERCLRDLGLWNDGDPPPPPCAS